MVGQCFLLKQALNISVAPPFIQDAEMYAYGKSCQYCMRKVLVRSLQGIGTIADDVDWYTEHVLGESDLKNTYG